MNKYQVGLVCLITTLKKRIPRLILRCGATGSILVALLWLIITPVFAIDAPDALQIDSVYVYQHCLETDDQLYLGEYTITYDPDNPDENVTEAYLFRLMDGATELKSATAYAYYDDGYGQGVFAIYFAATDPDLPTWEGVYSMQLIGNPLLTWDPSVPSTSVASFDLWSSSGDIATTQSELASRILYLADQLELSWGVNMIESTGSGSYLADYGEEYFANTIQHLQSMAPGAFAGSTSDPQWEQTDAPDPVYAEDRADSVDGTLLDVTDLAETFGVSRMWMSTMLFVIGSAFILYSALKPTGNFRGLSFLSTPFFIAGAYLGMLPMMVTVLVGFSAFALCVVFMFYHPSSA